MCSTIRARSLVVSDMRLENKGSRFESGCYPMCRDELPAVIVGGSGESGSVELKKCPPPSPAVLWFMNGRERKLQ